MNTERHFAASRAGRYRRRCQRKENCSSSRNHEHYYTAISYGCGGRLRGAWKASACIIRQVAWIDLAAADGAGQSVVRNADSPAKSIRKYFDVRQDLASERSKMRLRMGGGHPTASHALMRFVLFLVWATSVVAQSVEIGVVGGVPITHDFTAYTLNPTGAPGLCGECGSQRTLPYIIGPAIQIHLWRFLYLDAQGLYSRADYIHTRSFRDSSGGVSFYSVFKYKEGVDRWEIPILLKAQLSSWHSVHPFVAAGVSLQHSQMFLLPLPGIDVTRGSFSNSAIGPTFALGASLSTRWIRPSIEVRYTRWTEQPIPTGEITVHSKQDEVQLLAGLMFGIGRNRPDSRGVLEGPPASRRVTLGIKGGLLLTEALSARPTGATDTKFGTCFECGTTRTIPYVLGPALEVRLIGGLSLTAEAFYSRADYNHTVIESLLSFGSSDTHEKHSVDRWEAPLLLKYSFKMRRMTTFVTLG